MSNPKRHLVVILGLVMSLIVTACGGSGGDEAEESEAGESATTAPADGRGGSLIIGMTASNIPGTDSTLALTEGGEGLRFVGYQLYDALTRFDVSQGEKPPELEPALATEWAPSEDLKVWTFKLREGVKFHDGTDWNADAFVFNMDRHMNEDFEFYYPELNGISTSIGLRMVESYRKIDDYTVEITTKGSYAYLPEDMTIPLMASPTNVREFGNDGVADSPVGTGPFKFESMERGQQLTMVPNEDYWRKDVKLDKLIVRPMADAAARSAALRSGQVNWIEVPPPDEVTELREQYTVHTNVYSHNWPWILNTTQGPLADKRVRQALNYGIDRESLAENILNGTARPMTQYAGPADLGYDESLATFTYDPEKAKSLLAEAGYPDGFSFKLVYPTSGSGNMVPTPMNEALQKDLAGIGVDVELQPIEWSALVAMANKGGMPGDVGAFNISLAYIWPSLWSRNFLSTSVRNNGKYNNPEADALLVEAEGTVDLEARGEVLKKLNALLIEDSPWLVVVHDLNPRVTTNNVHGYVHPQSWFVDLTDTYVTS